MGLQWESSGWKEPFTLQPRWNAVGVDPKNVWNVPSRSPPNDCRGRNLTLKDVVLDATLEYPDGDIHMGDNTRPQMVGDSTQALHDLEEQLGGLRCHDNLGSDPYYLSAPDVTSPRVSSPVPSDSDRPWLKLNTRRRRVRRRLRNDSDMDSDSDDDYEDYDSDVPSTPVPRVIAPLPRRGRRRALGKSSRNSANCNSPFATPTGKEAPKRKARRAAEPKSAKKIAIAATSARPAQTVAAQEADHPPKAVPVPKPVPAPQPPPALRTAPAPKVLVTPPVAPNAQAGPSTIPSVSFTATASFSATQNFFPCTVPGCSHICKSAGDLGRHMESIAHQEPQYGCLGGCGLIYTRIDALRRHWERPRGRMCRGENRRRVEAGESGFLPLSASRVSVVSPRRIRRS